MNIIERIRGATHAELAELIATQYADPAPEILAVARDIRDEVYGPRVFFRGLIEVSNYCKNNCYYCGIRRGNRVLHRYRLTKEEILICCAAGYELGFRTFVIQGGEDSRFTDTVLCDIVAAVRGRYPDCAITLSMGERSRESYRALKDAGADRYLLRHETADASHYATLHPLEMTLETRMRCLYSLRELGFQVGAGLMVGSPGQTPEHLATDLIFLRELNPHMVGIGPFIPHTETPLRDHLAGSVPATLLMLALTRILLPQVLLPATTALGSVDADGREKGLLAGANVVMPNLSPPDVRPDYALYNGKAYSGIEATESTDLMIKRIKAAGYIPDFGRGDHPRWCGESPA